MATFDINSYFSKRYGNTGTDKMEAIAQASKNKVAALMEYRDTAVEYQAKKARDEVIDSQTVSGILGLEKGSTSKGIVDTFIASSVAPVTLAGEGIASALNTLSEAETDEGKAAELRSAGERIRNSLNLDSAIGINPDTGERTSSLQRRLLGDVAVTGVKGAVGAVQGIVGLGSLASFGAAGKAAEEAGFRPKEANRLLEDMLSPEQRLANRTVEQAEGFGNTLDTAFSNPSVIPLGVLQSVPSMVMGGGVGKAVGFVAPKLGAGLAGAIGEGTMMAGSQAENIRQETADGRLNLKQALLAAGTGVMGAGVGVLGNKLAKGLRVGDIDEALVTGALAKSPRSMPSNMVLAGALEGGEEVLQSTGEQIAQNVALNKAYDQGVGNAAAMGLVTGAPMGMLSGMSSSTDKGTMSPEQQTSFADSVTKNDPSAFLNPTSKTYSPSKAVGVLFEHAQTPDATPEVKTGNLKQATKIVDDLDVQVSSMKEDIAFMKQSPEEQQVGIGKLKAALEATDSSDVGRVSLIQETIAAMESLTGKTNKDVQLEEAKANNLQRELDSSIKLRDNLATSIEQRSTEEDFAKQITVASTLPDVTDPVAVEAHRTALTGVINLSMASSSSLSPTVALELANNIDNALTEPEREHFRKFHAARVAENALKTTKQVNQDIFTGSKPDAETKYVGLTQYRDRMAKAIRAGSQREADIHLKALGSFAMDHASKAAIAEQASKRGPGTQMVRGEDKQWSLATRPWTEPELRANGGLAMNSSDLLTAIKTEATAINSTLAELQSAYALKFNAPAAPVAQSTATPSTPNPIPSQPTKVTNGTQTTETLQAKAQGQEASPAAGVELPVAVKPAKVAQYTWDNAVATVNAFKQSNPALLDKLTELHAQDKTAGEISTDLGISAEAVRELRMGLGLPEQGKASGSVAMSLPADAEERAVFEAWRDARSNKPVNTPQAANRAEAAVQSTSSQSPVKESTQETVEDGARPEINSEASPTEETNTPKSRGNLSIFSEYKEKLEGTVNEIFNSVNLVAQYFKQKGSNKAALSQAPLVEVKDFFTQWNAGNVYPSDYLALPEGTTLTEEETRAISSLSAFLTKNLSVIRESFDKGEVAAEFKHEDMMQGLYVKGRKDVDENVKVAMVFAAYRWILDKANAPRYMTKESILEMHGKRESDPLSKVGEATLRNMSTFQHTAVGSLGSVVYQALGLQVSEDAPIDLQPRLETALGTHVLELLIKQGFARIDRIPYADVQNFFKAESSSEEPTFTQGSKDSADIRYVQFLWKDVNSKTEKVKDSISEIRASNKGSQDVLNKLMGVERSTRLPETAPQDFNQKKAKDSDREVPKVQAEVLDASGKTPYKSIPAMLDMANALGKAAILKIAGAVDLDKTNPQFHAVNRISLQTQNDNLDNQFEGLMELDSEQEFYMTPNVWKNFRAGFSNVVMNLQTSKLARFMFANPSWTTSIETSNEALMQEFLVSVAMNLGYKTDQKLNTTTVGSFYKKTPEGYVFENPKLNQAVDAIITKRMGEDLVGFSSAEIDLITSLSKEGMMSLQAMVAFAEYKKAMNAGAKDFKFTLLVGADGKTNGPMLTLLALGATDFKTLNRGGFYSTADGQAKHFSEYFQGTAAMDLYQDLGSKILENLKTKVTSAANVAAFYKTPYKQRRKADTPFLKEQLDAFQVLTSNLEEGTKVSSAMRNLVKTPLTSFFFGSAMKASVLGMEDAFIDGYYKALEEMKQGKRKEGNLESFIAATNTLIQQGDFKAAKLSTSLTIEALMELSLTLQQEKALRRSFQTIMGNSVKTAMEDYFRVFIDRRDKYNQTIQTAYATYEAAYFDAKKALLQKLMAEGKMAYHVPKKGVNAGQKIPKHDLTVAQEKVLRLQISDLLPVMHSAYSQQQGELNAGIFMGKDKVDVSRSPVYANKVRLGSGSKVNIQSLTYVGVSPGVAGLPYAMHSSDSFGMHTALKEVPNSLNVHDEISNSVSNIKPAAKAINKATAEMFLDYSPAREAVEMLYRMVLGADKRVAAGNMSPQAVARMFESWLNVLPAHEAEDQTLASVGKFALTRAFNNATRADKQRLKLNSTMASVDQYTWEGGQFEVDQKFRDAALAKLEKLPLEIPQDVLAALGRLQAAANASEEEVSFDKDIADLWESGNETTNQEPLVDTSQLGLPGVLASEVVNQLKEELPKALVDMVAAGTGIVKAINALPWETQEEAKERLMQASAEVNPSGYSLWGQLGKSETASNPVLVEAFEQNPTMNKSQILALVRQMLAQERAPKNIQEFNQALLTRLESLLDKDLEVRYLTKDMGKERSAGDVQQNSRGWFTENLQGKGVIHVLSPEHVHSGLTTELLLHELVHGALARVIEHELAMRAKYPDHSSQALDLIKDLETLQSKAAKHMADNQITGNFEAALGSIHEFVTWGMTNREFQQKVLSKITMASKTKKNPLVVTGLQDFVKKLVGLIFRGSDKAYQAITVNGMSVLIGNVSGLFEEAQTNKPINGVTKTFNMASATAQAMKASTVELYMGLATTPIGAVFDTHLQSLLSGIVDKLHGPFGTFKEDLMKDQALSPLDRFTKAQATGQAPFASSAITAGLPIKAQEAFVMEQVEATVRTALDSATGTSSAAYKELARLYHEVKKQIKVSDFHVPNATPIEIQEAQKLHDFIFATQTATQDRSDYLSRFAALGLAHEGFNKLLQVASDRDTRSIRDMKTFGDRLQFIFDKMLEMFYGRLTKTFGGQQRDAKLSALVDQLVDIEAKRRYVLAQPKSRLDLMDSVNDGIKSMAETGKTKLENFGQSDFFKKNKNVFVKAGGGVLSTVAGGRLPIFLDALQQMRDSQMAGKPGMVMGYINDLRGPKEVFQALLRMAKGAERVRKHIITQTAKFALGGFKDEGINLSDEDKASISAVLLRTGSHVLLDHFNTSEMETLLSDSVEMNKAIQTFTDKLAAYPKYKDYFIKQAKDLGYFKATGTNSGEFRMENAGNIARMLGTPYEGTLSDTQTADAESTLDVLVSLYGLKYARAKHTKAVIEILRTENNRPASEGNGVEGVLRLHKELDQQAKERLFTGSEVLRMKGFLPEIHNPHIEVVAADDVEGQALLDQGYSAGEYLPQDPNDPNPSKRLYVMRDGGSQPLTSGFINHVGNQSRGSKVHDGNVSLLNLDGQQNLATLNQITASKQAAIAAMFKADPAYDPAKRDVVRLSPVLNAKGKVINWRYMMDENTRDNLLQRNNDFANLLGSLAGTTFDKENALEQNRQGIQGLYDVYMQDFAKHPASFIEVGPLSSDPEMREVYAMLPPATKKAVKAIWGNQAMMVRKDSLDIAFGYHKLTAASIFEKREEDRNVVEAAMVFAVEFMLKNDARMQNLHRSYKGEPLLDPERYAKRAPMVVRKSERIWQEIVREVKDAIVIKTGTVMMGNLASNFMLLKMNGVPLTDIIKNTQIAWAATNEYQKNTAELFKLETQVATGYSVTLSIEIQQRIVELKDAIARSPVKSLIDSGLMPTIVEDTSADADIYSYKSALARKVEKYTDQMNPAVVSAARTAYMAHDTKLYQSISHVTQLSDFTARYVLYQHLTTRKEEPLSMPEAIQEASDAFVNYDIPMQRGLQYMEDVGLTMFSKYFMRIQRVIVKMTRQHPGQVLEAMLLNHYFEMLPTVLDSSVIGRIGNNPLSTGALQYPSSLMELLTVKAGIAAVN